MSNEQQIENEIQSKPAPERRSSVMREGFVNPTSAVLGNAVARDLSPIEVAIQQNNDLAHALNRKIDGLTDRIGSVLEHSTVVDANDAAMPCGQSELHSRLVCHGDILLNINHRIDALISRITL